MTVSVDISVVIPCLNGAATLGRQLDALLAQETDAEFEVVVADNGSTDGTAELVRKYSESAPHVRIVDAGGKRGVNVARNVGARCATGSHIVLCDADDMVQPGWLDAYWIAFQRGAQCVGGGVDRVLDSGEVLSRDREPYYPFIKGPAYADGANCGFTADAFRRVGGFDESFAGGADEIDFFWRLAGVGYELVMVPDAVVDKRMHTNLCDTFRQFFHFGCGEALLARKFKPRLLPLLMVIAWIHTCVWLAVAVTAARINDRWRRSSASALAWNLGLLSEGYRLTLQLNGAAGVAASMSLSIR